MAVHKPNPNPNAFVRFMRKVYHPIGFKKGYNFTLYFIFAGALLGFILAKLAYMDVNGYYKAHAGPGEWFWFSKRFYNIMLRLHLCAICPAGLLAIVQFTPIVRHKALILHRVNGYVVVLLFLIGNVGAVGCARHAFGGSLATQTGVGVLAIATTTSLFMAIYNIKRVQIDQHRAWMLRVWVYAGIIITVRLIQPIMAIICSQAGNYFAYYTIWHCRQIALTDSQAVADSYPACLANPDGLTIVRANLSNPQSATEAGAALQLGFGAAIWLGLALHAVGIEIYLRLTPAEGERLRQVSYERQLERGLSPAGSAGLTVDRLGDAEEWKPATESSSAVAGTQQWQDKQAALVDAGSRDSSSIGIGKPPSVSSR